MQRTRAAGSARAHAATTRITRDGIGACAPLGEPVPIQRRRCAHGGLGLHERAQGAR